MRSSVEGLVERYRKSGKHRNGRAIIAMDALECDRSVHQLLGHLLRGTVLTDSYALAVYIQ
jgi:hypothetical protein